MSNNTCSFFVLVLAVLFLAGCGPSEADVLATQTQVVAAVLETQTAAAPTQTPVPTLTVTPSPLPTLTQTPTATQTPEPTATPDYSTITLLRSDLPDDFYPRSNATVGLNEPGKDGNWGLTISSFIFSAQASDDANHIIFGFVEHIPDPQRQYELDYGMEVLAELWLEGIAKMVGAEEVENLLPLEGIDLVGEAQAGYTGIIDGETGMDLLMFRRGPFLAVIFGIYPAGDILDPSTGELGDVLDGRMKDSLAGEVN